MRIQIKPPDSGIALIMVMLVTVALAILAAGFAYTMKVETKLARNASVDTDMEWMGHSGIELAKYILAEEGNTPRGGQVDSLKQYWAGGMGETNSPLVQLVFPWKLGVGEIDRPTITDCESKFNINAANEVILRQALNLIGVDAGSFPTIVDSILDWQDQDDRPRMAGSESDFYQRLTPPYFAKDGPLDDLSELLLVNGVTPEIYWGSAAVGHTAMLNKPKASRSRFDEPIYEIGLKDLFSAIPGASRQVNINTALAKVLQMVPEIDENIANAIIEARQQQGPDGQPGQPFHSVQELGGRVPAFANPNALQILGQYFTVRSSWFEVKVTVRAGGTSRTYVGLLHRASPRDIQVMSMYWK